MAGFGTLILFALPLVAMLALVVALNRPDRHSRGFDESNEPPSEDAA
jgi:hypothetical protein